VQFPPTPQHVHMHARKHAWNDGVAATAREATTGAGSSARLLCSTQAIVFSTYNTRTSLYPLLETPNHLYPPSPLPNRPQISSRTAGKRSSTVPTLMSYRVHNSGEVPCSFTMASCVVVKRLEGRQTRGCSSAPVGEHTGGQARTLDAQRGCSRETKGQRRTTQPHSSPAHHHDRAPPRQHTVICTGAETIHPVHDRLRPPATETILRNRFTFQPFFKLLVFSNTDLSLFAWLTAVTVNLFIFFIEQVLLYLVVGGGGCRKPWDRIHREILPPLRSLTNEAERILDSPRQQSQHGKSPWSSTG